MQALWVLLLTTGLASAVTIAGHDAAPFVRGRAFSDTSAFYNRFPASAEGVVPDSVWGLSEDPAGLYLQFMTNTTSLLVNYTLGSSSLDMWHFPSTGVSGIDLYSFDESEDRWRWIATSAPKYPVTAATFFTSDDCPADAGATTRRYRIHLPM